MESTFTVEYYFHNPANSEEWNKLAESNSNFIQSTFFDDVQLFFKEHPVYFEARVSGELVGGVKLYLWESKKLGKLTSGISRSVTQFAELLSKFPIESSEFAGMRKLLKEKVVSFLKESKTVTYTVAGLYGEEQLLIDLDREPDSTTLFNTSYVDLDKPIEEVLAGFNRNTNRNIKKAQAAGIEVVEEKIDIDLFLNKLNVVYDQQIPKQNAPNNDFVRHIFKNLAPGKFVDIHFAKLNDEILSTSFFLKMGKNAYSWFGGSLKNDVGAGQYIYWQLMKKYQLQGIRRFYFGQVAREIDTDNVKFTKGITTFKKGFGLIELNSFSKTYTLYKTKRKIWELLLKVYSTQKISTNC